MEDLRVKKTYKLLNEALLSLLKEMPFEEIKVTDICDRAMVHRTTFYSHFKDKYELLEYFITDLQKGLESCVEEKYNTRNPYEYYLEVASIFLDHIAENKEIYTSVIQNNANSITVDILYNIFVQEITKKIENDGITEIPAKIIATYYFGGVFFTVIDWLRSSSTISKEDLFEYLKKLIIN